MAKRWNFKDKIAKLKRAKTSLPRKLGVIQKEHFLGSFRAEGFTDKTLTAWQRRKRPDKKGRRRSLLVKSSALKRSIRTRRATFREIRTGSYGIRYSSRHNQGLDGMPKRQFVGKSFVMRRKIKKRINREIEKVLK